MSGLFLDASYAIALAAPTDRNHARARALAAKIKKDASPLTTTWPVLLEIGNSLARARYRAAAVRSS